MPEMPREILDLRDDLAQHGDQEVTVVAYLKPRSGKEEETRELLFSLIEPTLVEPGCIQYALYRSNDDPSVFMFFEIWRSKEDLDKHLTMPHLKPLYERKSDLLSEDIDVKLYTMASDSPE